MHIFLGFFITLGFSIVQAHASFPEPAPSNPPSEKPTRGSLEVLAIEYPSYETLPQRVRPLFTQQPLSANDRYVVYVSLLNDSQNLSPVALGAATISGNQQLDGNDVYKTHGLEIGIQKKGAKGITYSASAKSDLYTQPLNSNAGNTETRQEIHFTEENVFQLLVDNKGAGKVFYWKAGLGWQWLNQNEVTALGATGQQQVFHDLVNSENQAQHVYVPNDRPSRMGGFVDFSVGILRSFSNQRRWNFQGSVDGGLRLGSISHTTAAIANADLSAQFRVSKRSEIAAGLAGRAVFHDQGTEVDPQFYLGYRRRTWGLKSSVEFPRGKLQNYVDYNLDQEPIARMSLYIFIPNRARKR